MNLVTKWIPMTLLTMALGAGAQSTGSPAPSRQSWISAWACATQPFFKGENGPYTELHDQTARMFVRPTIGGSMVRVRLSAAASYNAVSIDAASIAVRGKENAMLAGTLRSLSFHGQKRILIPAGSTIWSDPVALPVEAFHDLVISLHIPEYTGTETGHAHALGTNFLLAGDQTAAESVPAASTTQGVGASYFLQAVDVRADEHTYAIVAFGDSITDGVKSTWGVHHGWPDFFAGRLAEAHGAITSASFAVLNEGISGNRLLHEYTGPNALSRIGRDILEQPGVRMVFLLEGINDINQNANNPKGLVNQIASSAQIIEAYQQIADRLHAAGIKLILGTLTPDKGIEQYNAQIEKDRTAVNGWIRTSKSIDGVIDFDTALRDPADPARLLAIYDSGDHIHPSDAGYKAMAEAIDIRSLIGGFLSGELLPSKGKKDAH